MAIKARTGLETVTPIFLSSLSIVSPVEISQKASLFTEFVFSTSWSMQHFFNECHLLENN